MARFIDVRDRAGKAYNLNIEHIVYFTAESESSTSITIAVGGEPEVMVIAVKYTDFVAAVLREARN